MNSLRSFADTAKGLARNPIGIIALFIVLIYGFASLVAGASQNLTADERQPIIWFLVLFPFVVLGAFVWLVTKHHTKLYAPSDYQKDDAFIRASELSSTKLVATSAGHMQIETTEDVEEQSTTEERQQQRRTRLEFELVPSSNAISKGDNFEIAAKISGLGGGEEPTLGGFTLVLLWNVHQLDFLNITYSDELGDERRSHRSSNTLGAGVFNPADPDFAAIIFGNYSNLSDEELTGTQSSYPVIATFRFRSLTNGPIRLNAGFPFAANSLIDSQRRPTFDAGVKALFLNMQTAAEPS